MGDRATFVIEQTPEDAPIYLYGHYAGYKMMSNLAAAIDHAKVRIDMDDPWYAARMITSKMIGEDWNSEYGWGISTRFLDSEHSVPVINLTDKTVRLIDHSLYSNDFDINAEPKFVMNIDAFIAKFSK